MIDKILKAKHWQIFIVAFGLPFFIQFVSILFIILSDNPMAILKVMPIIMIFFIGGLYAWFWSIGVGLQAKVPSTVKMNVKLFKVFFVIPLLYMLLIVSAMLLVFNGAFDDSANSGPGMFAMLFAFIFPCHIFSMFCMFYCLYFVARTFKTVELQREVSFSDFAGEFFMIWFFPIGIWIIQPKINQMMEEEVGLTK